MDTLLRDMRYAARMLVKNPGYTLTAVVALALGIGANTAIFSVVNGVLLRSLPYREPERLVMVQSIRLNAEEPTGSASYPDFRDWREQSTQFERLAVFRSNAMTLTGRGEPERLTAARVSADFLPVLGVEPHLGRGFAAQEDVPGSPLVAILSHGFWQRRFGGDPGILGQPLMLDGQSFTVIGVLPPNFKFPIDVSDADIWTSLAYEGPLPLLEQRGAHFLKTIGRLKPGASLASAQAEMDGIAARLEQQYPEDNTGRVIVLKPLYEQLVSPIRPALLILLGAVALVLLICCANVANLLLARAAARQKEMAVRAALGAGRGRIVRQLLTESVLLALAGGGAGLLLAVWGVDALAALAPQNLPRLDEIRIDPRVLGFTLLLSALTGIVFGLAPALKASRADVNEALKEGGRGMSMAAGRRLRGALVVAQMAIALMLLISAGLLVRSFLRLQQVDPGFQPRRALTMQVTLPDGKYPEGHQIAHFYRQAESRLRALPGVEAVGSVNVLPLSGSNISVSMQIEGRPMPAGQAYNVQARAVTPDYFRAAGIPLVGGRGFTEQDVMGKPGVALISEETARRYFAGEDPIGKQIAIGITFDGDPGTREVVGVVGNVRHTAIDAVPLPEVYVPHAQQPWQQMSFVVRTSGDPAAIAAAARRQIQSLDAELAVAKVRTFDELVAASISQPRFYTLLLGVFAGIALVLAAVGIYGVINYTVAQRTHEIGIRMALGAARGDVLRMVLKQGMWLALAGAAAGMCGALLLSRLLESLLFGVSPNDPLTFALIPLALLIVALLACYVPARRATKVDPMEALRYE